MSSLIAITAQIPDHAAFGVTWDDEYNQHLVRLTDHAALYLSTADARALYASLGASLASRGAVALPDDLPARLERFARVLHWAGQPELADELAEILAGNAEPEPAQRIYAGRGPNGAPLCRECARIGHVEAHPDLGCGDVGCVVAHLDEPAAAK